MSLMIILDDISDVTGKLNGLTIPRLVVGILRSEEERHDWSRQSHVGTQIGSPRTRSHLIGTE